MISEYARAYYFAFQLTGVEKVDAILKAVARAGKAFHHTDQWADEKEYLGGKSYVDLIQEAANALADEMKV